MEFTKYVSIENSYREKFIDRMLMEFPELQNIQFIITEKIHGTHTMFVFEPNGDMHICSRNRRLGSRDDKHFGIWDYVDAELTELVSKMKEYAESQNSTITLHGEFFGPGIQKGIDYGKRKRFLIFDIRIDSELMPQSTLIDIMAHHGLLSYLVPIITVVDGLEKALAFNIEFDSLLSSNEDNICEGIVIKPFKKVFRHWDGKTFYLKKKNAKFSEKKQTGKPKEAVVYFEQVERLRAEFISYITENRVQNVFSKEGEIDDPKSIGRYIGFVMKDAQQDFEKDFGDQLQELEKKEKKHVFAGTAKMIVDILRKHL